VRLRVYCLRVALNPPGRQIASNKAWPFLAIHEIASSVASWAFKLNGFLSFASHKYQEKNMLSEKVLPRSR
jgi:hypothetical protein